MKGVVLAGGTGSRLDPLTRILNKHVLPVYDRPMIYYPLECLARSGVSDVLLISGPQHIDAFKALLDDGSEVGLRLHYGVQTRAGGIAHALAVAEPFVDGTRSIVMLGDNLVEYTIEREVEAFEAQREGARILLSAVDNPSAFGIAEFDGSRLQRVVEKPTSTPSHLAVTGIYMYDSAVFDIVRTLRPSGRGELEITDVNMAYLERGMLTWSELLGWWIDAGENFDQYLATCNRIAAGGANHPQPS
jgi:glucose-1-phosphate thymidylyltransferase